MRKNIGLRSVFGLAGVACAAGGGLARGATYAGNGGTGFGGPVGTGSLAVTDDGAGDVTFAFTPGVGHPSLDGNNLVIYLATGAAGLADTSTLIDTGSPAGSDNGHTSISGYNDFNQTPPSRTVIAFPSGFAAAYALSFANAYDGLFSLPTDGSGELGYVTGAAPVNDVNTLTIPLSDLGLAQGQSFAFVATDIDGSSAYRSNEAIGDAVVNGTTTSLTAGGNPGFNNLITFTDDATYQTTPVAAVPEPAGLSLLVAGGMLAARRRRGATADR